jgi:hypothetical protein
MEVRSLETGAEDARNFSMEEAMLGGPRVDSQALLGRHPLLKIFYARPQSHLLLILLLPFGLLTDQAAVYIRSFRRRPKQAQARRPSERDRDPVTDFVLARHQMTVRPTLRAS